MTKIRLIPKDPAKTPSIIHFDSQTFKPEADGSFIVDDKYVDALRNHGLVIQEESEALTRACVDYRGPPESSEEKRARLTSELAALDESPEQKRARITSELAALGAAEAGVNTRAGGEG